MKLNNIWDKIIDFFGFSVPEEKTKNVESFDEKKVISIYKQEGFRIIVHHPESFSEVQNIVDQLKSKKPIILNLTKLEREKARRIVDFISGAVYGIGGSVQKISDAIFVFTSDNVLLEDNLLKNSKSLFK